ncbi:MAG: hypothetical protein ACM3U2_01320 [Deltaproteobacteria bacterium]
MITRTNISMVGMIRRCVEVCCRGCRMVARKCWIPFTSVLLWSNVGQAQVVVAPVGVGYGGWGGVGTAESSAAHGYADMIRSEGYYNLTTAQGMVEAEKARNLLLQNRKEAYRAYWAGKEQRSAIDAQKRERSRHSAEALKVAGKSDAAQPLSTEVLNPVTGKIVWPKALLDSQYTAKRAEVEKLFELRARTSGGANSQTKIQVATSELAAQLKTNITKISSTDYVKARKFLDSLAVSATQS